MLNATAASFRAQAESLEDRTLLTGAMYLNEVAYGLSSGENFIELRGDANSAIPAGSYLVVVSGNTSPDGGYRGRVASAIPLGGTFDSNGIFTIVQESNPYSVNPSHSFSIPSGTVDYGSATFMLIQTPGFVTPGDDIDSNNDGAPDGAIYASWTVHDSVSIVRPGTNPSGYGGIVFTSSPSVLTPVNSVVIPASSTINYVARVDGSTGYAASDWVASTAAGGWGSRTLQGGGATYPYNLGGAAINTVGGVNHFDAPEALFLVGASTNLSERGALQFEVRRTTEDISSPVVVTLASTSPERAEIPQTVTIPANEYSATFTITGINDGVTDQNHSISLFANATGYASAEQALVVVDDGLLFTSLLTMNEILFTASDANSPTEYFELRGTPNTDIPLGTYLIGINGDADDAGDVQFRIDLSRLEFGSTGYLVLSQQGNSYAVSDGTTVLTSTTTGFAGLPNGRFQADSGATEIADRSLSFLLIQSATAPALTADVDADNDGVLDGDALNWTIIDPGIAILDGDAGDQSYAALAFLVNGVGNANDGESVSVSFRPGYVGRIGDSTGYAAVDWLAAVADGTSPNVSVTTGASSPFHLGGAPFDHLGSSNNFNAPETLFLEFGGIGLSRTGTILATLRRTAEDLSELTVSLQSSDPSSASVPATVTFLAGEETVTFEAVGVPGGSAHSVTISFDADEYLGGDLELAVTSNPVLNRFLTPRTYTENSTAVVLASTTVLTDDTPIFDGGELIVSILNSSAGDQIVLRDHRNVTTSGYAVGDSVFAGLTEVGQITSVTNGLTILFNQNATLALVEDVYRSVSYQNVLDNPAEHVRQISLDLLDGRGGAANQFVQQVSVIGKPDAPTLNVNVDSNPTYAEGGQAIVLAPNLTLTDPDEHPDWNGSTVTVSLQQNNAHDRLTIENQGTGAGQISVSGNIVSYEGQEIGTATGGEGLDPLVISITGGSTAAVQALLRAVQYHTVDQVLSGHLVRQVTFRVVDPDGRGNSSQGVSRLTIHLDKINTTPTLAGFSEDALAFTENDPPLLIAASATLSDDDYVKAGRLTVSLTGGSNADVLEIVESGAITLSGSNVLVNDVVIAAVRGGTHGADLSLAFRPAATIADVELVLRAIAFSNSSDDPGGAQRLVQFTLSDGDGAVSNVASVTLDVTSHNDAPTVGRFLETMSTKSGRTFSVAGVLTVSDPDSPDFDSGLFQVNLSDALQAGESLWIAETPGRITLNGNEVLYEGIHIGDVSIDSTSLTVALNANATPLAVQMLARSIRIQLITPRALTIQCVIDDGDGGQTLTPEMTVVFS